MTSITRSEIERAMREAEQAAHQKDRIAAILTAVLTLLGIAPGKP